MTQRPDGLTLQNWPEAPYNRWGFWHVREMARTARISRGTGSVTDLPRAASPLDFDQIVVDHEGSSFPWADWLTATQTDAMVVLHEGNLIYEWYIDGYGPTDTHLLMSCSKSLTSLCLGTLVAEDLVDTTKPVTDYIPRLRGTSFDGATVQHVLDMRTGSIFDETDYDDPMSDGHLIEEVSGYRPREHDDLPVDTQAWIAGLQNDREHGGVFEYRSILSDVLAWIIEDITGQPFTQAFSERIWGGIGAERDADVVVDDAGFPAVEGGICTTIRDFARVGLMCLGEGEIDGRRVLPADWFARLREDDQDLLAAYTATHGVDPSWPNARYHDQWWVIDPAIGMYSGYGINGQQLLIHPPSKTVVAKFSTWRTADSGLALQDAGVVAICDLLTPG